MVPNPGSLRTTGKPEVSPYLRHDLYETWGQREIFVYISLAKNQTFLLFKEFPFFITEDDNISQWYTCLYLRTRNPREPKKSKLSFLNGSAFYVDLPAVGKK